LENDDVTWKTENRDVWLDIIEEPKPREEFIVSFHNFVNLIISSMKHNFIRNIQLGFRWKHDSVEESTSLKKKN